MGGDLATIHDAEENQAIIDSVAGRTIGDYVWIGLNDKDSEGNFVWADGSDSAYRNWADYEPDNGVYGISGEEDCVQMGVTGDRWIDTSCNYGGYPLCMFDLGCQEGFQMFEGHCYKKTDTSANWADSRASCQGLGGDLVTIDSAEEQTFITDSFYSSPTTYNLWTGLNNQAGSGFVWADGSSPSYTNWMANQPDNNNGNEHCVITIFEINTYPTWNDFNCDRSDDLFGLCEVVPPTVESLGNTASCSEGVASGLSAQIMAEYASRSGLSFSAYDGQWVKCPSGKCSGFLQTEVSSALVAAAVAKGAAISIYSDYRSSAEQYLLTRWAAGGMCGMNQQMTVTAPATNRLATGRAINVKPSSLRGGFTSELLDHGFMQYMANDPNYYAMSMFVGEEAEELMAFQALWNRNMPSFQIEVNGKYDGATMYALANSPVNGW